MLVCYLKLPCNCDAEADEKTLESLLDLALSLPADGVLGVGVLGVLGVLGVFGVLGVVRLSTSNKSSLIAGDSGAGGARPSPHRVSSQLVPKSLTMLYLHSYLTGKSGLKVTFNWASLFPITPPFSISKENAVG